MSNPFISILVFVVGAFMFPITFVVLIVAGVCYVIYDSDVKHGKD